MPAMKSRQNGPAARRWRALSVLAGVRRCGDNHGLRSCAHLQFRECLLERLSEPAHDLADLFLRNDEGRRDHHEIAIRAIGLANVRPHGDTGVERGIGESFGKLRRAWEWGAARLVFDKFDASEE